MVLPSEKYGMPKTDHSKWRLVCDELGKQNWIYDVKGEIESTNFTKYQLGIETGKRATKSKKAKSPREAAQSCLDFLKYLQDPCGTIPCQYSGPMFMLIGYVVARYYFGVPFPEEQKVEITRYLINRAHPVDGGWGLHSYDKSTAFGTTINYVICRILGMPSDHPALVKARNTLHRLGGAIGNPHWGKAYLAILNLFDWSGVNPAPPEFWLMPYSVIIHPGRWWVHTRAIYLPLSYLSSNRITVPVNDLILELRKELYVQPYGSIDFSKHRNTICSVDLYYPHTKLLDCANWFMVQYEKIRPAWLQKKCNDYVVELILKDLENTDHLAIAPVSNAMNAIVMKHRFGLESPHVQRFLYRWPDFLFMTPEGLNMSGTNGVQVWDVAFALQYSVVAGLAKNPENHEFLVKGYRFLLRSQFVDDTVPGSFRDHRVGGWPFSTQTQGFTVSDCTAEAIKAILMIQNVKGLEYLKNEISEDRLCDGIDVLMTLQNTGSFHYGAFASYEQIKSTELLEKLNPAEVFGNIMVEYPYVECTDSSVLGMTYFTKYSKYRAAEIDESVSIALDYIISFQSADGSWYGSWGVCYTYAGMFAIEALSTKGYTYQNSETVRKGCDFLVHHVNKDGGWGENFRTCEVFSYVAMPSSPVNTAWSLIALILGKYPNKNVIERGIKWLIEHQNADGSYDWCHVEGVFNHSCAIEYPNYKFYFPMKALGMYAEVYGDSLTV